MAKNSIGILLTNIGSPDDYSPSAVKKYLKHFLSDPRVIEINPILWKPILHGFILLTRPKQSAKLYQKIWTDAGSPLIVYSKKLAEKLENHLQTQFNNEIYVTLGMHYGEPSIHTALQKLREKKCEQYIVLPLYPQYSATTTATTFDQVYTFFKKQRYLPQVHFINQYGDHPAYISAICKSINQIIKEKDFQHLLFSFHSIPKRYVDKGDPYGQQCQESASFIAQNLKLPLNNWSVAFQSRIGKTKWLGPYTDKTLQILPQQNITNLHVVCPGFAVDCLETLEEINIRGRKQFLEAGGKNFYYIPALNDSMDHVSVLTEILKPSMML